MVAGLSWVFYAVDISVVLLALVSLVLLCLKLKQVKKIKEKLHKIKDIKSNENDNGLVEEFKINLFDIDNLEYLLLKLRYLKSSRLISCEEYNDLRMKLMHKDLKEEVGDVEMINKKRD